MHRDKIIERVINKIKARSDVGYKKYGVTLNDDEKKLAEKAALTTAKFMWNFLSGLAIKHKLPLQTAP